MYQAVQLGCGVTSAEVVTEICPLRAEDVPNSQLSLRSINWLDRVVVWPGYLIGTQDKDVCDSRDANRLRLRENELLNIRRVWITLEQADTGQEQDEEQELLHYCYCGGRLKCKTRQRQKSATRLQIS